jgi:hypothetical protein
MKFATAKLQICANQLNRFYIKSRFYIFFKNRNNMTVDFKNLKSVGVP